MPEITPNKLVIIEGNTNFNIYDEVMRTILPYYYGV